MEDTEGEEIVRTEDRVRARLWGTGDERLADRAPDGERALGHLDDLPRHTVRPSRRRSSREALLDLYHAERAADEGDATASAIDEVLDRETTTGDVVDGDGRLRRIHRPLPDDDRRGAALADGREPRVEGLVRRGDDAAHLMLLEEPKIGILPLAAAVRVRDEHRQSALIRPTLDRLGDLGEVGVAHVGHQIAEEGADPHSQLPSGAAGHEAQRVDRLPYPPGLRLGYALGVVEKVRDGADGHLGHRRDLADSGSGHSLPSARRTCHDSSRSAPVELRGEPQAVTDLARGHERLELAEVLGDRRSREP